MKITLICTAQSRAELIPLKKKETLCLLILPVYNNSEWREYYCTAHSRTEWIPLEKKETLCLQLCFPPTCPPLPPACPCPPLTWLLALFSTFPFHIWHFICNLPFFYMLHFNLDAAMTTMTTMTTTTTVPPNGQRNKAKRCGDSGARLKKVAKKVPFKRFCFVVALSLDRRQNSSAGHWLTPFSIQKIFRNRRAKTTS